MGLNTVVMADPRTGGVGAGRRPGPCLCLCCEGKTWMPVIPVAAGTGKHWHDGTGRMGHS